MDRDQKVVWSEGMFLTPHHFQQWDRYYEEALTRRIGALMPFGWGVAHLDLDADGLAGGNVTLLGFKGIFPDGLSIDLPEVDPSPEMRSVIPLFPPSRESIDVYLGIAAEREGAPNCRLDETVASRPTRYRAAYLKMPDRNTGENVREIAVARKDLRLFFSGEEMADVVSIKIAELVRTQAGNIVLKEGYIPPALAISASPLLMRMVRGILELLSAKSTALAGRQNADPGAAHLALLQTVNGTIPLLSHFHRIGKVHPETLFLALSRLAAELFAFSPGDHPRDLPPYHHTDLSKSFVALEQKIRGLIEGVTPIRHVVIPLERKGENVLIGRVADPRLFQTAQFYLGVAGDFPEEQTRESVPRRIKVGAPGELDALVSTALPGVTVSPILRLPGGLPAKAGHLYFRLDPRGAFWDAICRDGSVAFHLPPDMKMLRLELLAVSE